MGRITDPAGALAALLAPVTPQTFFGQFWERQPLHVARDAAGTFADVYDIADVEESLLVGGRELARFALVKANAPQAALEEYAVTRPAIRWKSTGKVPTAHVDPARVAALLERGYTLVISDAALLSARLQRTCNRLQRDLDAFVGANVYLTPAGAQGLDVHHDTHDTLTIQIEGAKTWRVYEPQIELPLESQPLHRGTRVPKLTLREEITLAAGETLYLPRGFAHEAIAADTRALHVTFAIAPVRTIDLLHELLDVAAAADANLRKALPLGWHDDPAFAPRFAADLPRGLAGIDPAAVTQAGNAALNALFAASRTDAHAAFERAPAAANLGAATRLRVNEDLPLIVRDHVAGVEVLLPGSSLTFSAACRPALARLQAGPTAFGALAPELAGNDARTLAHALLRAGVVVVVDQG